MFFNSKAENVVNCVELGKKFYFCTCQSRQAGSLRR